MQGQSGVFQPAPEERVFQPAPQEQEDPKQVQKNARSFLLFGGVIIAILLVATPMWDSIDLLRDPTMVYFMTDAFPIRVLFSCLAFIIVWLLAVGCFFQYSRQEGMTELSIVTLVTMLLTSLGIAMLLITLPAMDESDRVYDDLFGACSTSPATSELAAYSQVLQELRQSPGCIGLQSIEDCEGYEESDPYTNILKAMETEYRCAGFCYTPIVATATDDSTNTNASAAATDNSPNTDASSAPRRGRATDGDSSLLEAKHSVSLRDRVLQASYKARAEASELRSAEIEAGEVFDGTSVVTLHSGRTRSKKSGASAMLLSVGEEEVAQIDASGEVTSAVSEHFVEAEANSQRQEPDVAAYPPTLFTNANYQSSCDGAAARDIKLSYTSDVLFVYYQGCMLVLLGVLATMLKLIGFCSPVSRRKMVY